MDKTKTQEVSLVDQEANATMIATAAELAKIASERNIPLRANEIVRKIGLPPIKGSSGPRLFY